MVSKAKTPSVLTLEQFVDVYEEIRRIQEKLRTRYPEAEFLLRCGPDSTLELYVWTRAESVWEPMDLTKDDQDELLRRHDISLYVVPGRFPDDAEAGSA